VSRHAFRDVVELIICFSFLDFTLVKYLVHKNHGKFNILDMIHIWNPSGCHVRNCTSDCRSCLFKHFFMVGFCNAFSVRRSRVIVSCKRVSFEVVVEGSC
jgi:hypothetical protein